MRVGRTGAAALLVLALACVPTSEEPVPTASESSAAQPTPSSTAAPSGSESAEGPLSEELDVAYAHTFPSADTKWPTGLVRTDGIVATTAVRDGVYTGSVEARAPSRSGSHRMLAPEILYGLRDVEVSANVRKVGTTGAVGVMCFQHDDEWLGYEFGIDSDGWVGIAKRTEFDGYNVLAQDTVPDLVRPRGGNHLAARCTSSAGRVDLVLTLNGTEVIRIADTRAPLPQDGAAGLSMGTNRRGTIHAAFDDFQVRAAVSATGPPPALEPTEEASDGAELTYVNDNFGDQFSGWDVVARGQTRTGEIMGYRDAAYTMRSRPPATGFASVAPVDREPPEGDVAVEVDVRLAAGRGTAGLFCRASPDGSSSYLAGVGTDGGYAILRIGGDAPRPLTEPNVTDPALRDPRQVNRLRLECIGTEGDTTLRLYANDKLITEVADPEPLPAAGDVGLFVLAATPRATLDAVFDNFLARREAASV